jgi:hypothetical protein
MDVRGMTSPLEGTLFLWTGNYGLAHSEKAERLRDVAFGLALLVAALGSGVFWDLAGPASQTSAAELLIRYLT